MKKLTNLLLSTALLLSLAACGGTGASSAPAPEQTASPAPSAPVSAEPMPEATAPAGDGKTLVVYYSATNRTEAVAQTIADAMGGDLFEIVPTTPYTSEDLNWRNENSRVSREHADPVLQTVELETVTPDNWADYDAVFIGYPIWWSDMPMILYTFFDSYDFSGKTLIPFGTHGGSGWADTPATIRELEPNANILEGLSISRNVIEDAHDQIVEWVRKLDI